MLTQDEIIEKYIKQPTPPKRTLEPIDHLRPSDEKILKQVLPDIPTQPAIPKVHQRRGAIHSLNPLDDSEPEESNLDNKRRGAIQLEQPIRGGGKRYYKSVYSTLINNLI